MLVLFDDGLLDWQVYPHLISFFQPQIHVAVLQHAAAEEGLHVPVFIYDMRRRQRGARDNSHNTATISADILNFCGHLGFLEGVWLLVTILRRKEYTRLLKPGPF